MWYYNRDLFDQVGATVPTTWAEFIAVCGKLKDAGITPIAAIYDHVITWWLSAYYFDQYHVNWIETIRAQEGDWNYDPEFDGAFVYDPTNPNIHRTYTFSDQRYWQAVRDGVIRYDTPEVAELVKNMSAIFPDYANADLFVATDYYPAFIQQQSAMIFDTTGSLTALSKDVPALEKPFNWGYFNNPPMEGPLVKGPVRCSESAVGEYLSIIQKDQTQTDRCLDFLMFWISAAGYQPYLNGENASGTFSPGGPLKVKGVSDAGEAETLFGGVEFTGTAAVLQNWFVYPGGGDTGPVNETAANLYSDALQKKIAPEEYATRLQALFTDNLAELIDYVGLTNDDLDNPARQPGS
jgi:ABC-type glycerol-3-phosphate transport system substrate-binding protein